MSSALKWGIVSAGKICHDFTICLRSLPSDEHQVVAVAARSLDSAQKFAATHHIPKSYGSYEELAADPDVQVVYIGTITSEHLRLGKLMLNHGKHVLIEKPLAMSRQSVETLVKLAQEKQLFLMEAIWSRHLPSYDFMLKQLEEKTIGDVYDVQSTFGIPIAEIDRIGKKSMGGGIIYDLGVYTINAILMAYGDEKPLEVVSTGHLNSEGVDESVAASFKFSNGKTASLTSHSRAELSCETILTGTKGQIKMCKPMWCTDVVYVNETKHEFPFPPTVAACYYTNSSGLRYQAIEARKCIMSGNIQSDRLPHATSILIASIQDQLRESVGYTDIFEPQ